MDPKREVMKEFLWGLALALHLTILFHLYFGTNVHTDSDPHNWDLPQLVAASGIFVYVGILSCISCWGCGNLERSRHLNTTFNSIATALPFLSVVFSLFGIGHVLWESAVFSRERIYLVVLYTLNILLISLFTQALGLWSEHTFPRRQELTTRKFSTGKHSKSTTAGKSSVGEERESPAPTNKAFAG